MMVMWRCEAMKNRSSGWLENKIREFGSFDGSLLKYVDSAGVVKKKAAKLEVSPPEILKLDSNENFFVSAEDLNALLRDAVQDIDLRLYNPEGFVQLNEALGKYVGAPPECITVSSGSEQLIDLIVNLFLEKGDSVISIVPSFFAYEKRVALKKAAFIGVPLNKDLSLNKEAIVEKSTSKTRLVFICSPNNPTGNQFEWRDIEALADEASGVVVLDEAYAEFADYSVASLAVKKRNTIVLRTFSKGFGLAGMRFGYAVAHPDLALPLSNIIPYTVSTVAAKFAVKLLSSIDIIKKSVESVKAERERLIESLRSIKRVKVFDSEANFVTFKPYKNADRVHRELLKRGIIIKNLGDLPIIGRCLRVTVGLPYMNDQFLDALKPILEDG
jgi:histidinol-phosphate aminotransferase